MKRLGISIGFFLLVLASSVHAQNTMYVNDVIKITMRTGPGIDHKVIAMLQSGETVQVLERNNDWSRVRLPDGKEGWALTRFLTGKKPNEVRLRQIEEKYDELSQKADSLTQDNKRLQEENQQLLTRAEEAQGDLEQMVDSFNNLKSESADYLNIKTAYEDASTELKAQREKAETMTARVSKLEWKRNVMYFMSGAGVFLLGFIIGGFNEKGKRRRSPYM